MKSYCSKTNLTFSRSESACIFFVLYSATVRLTVQNNFANYRKHKKELQTETYPTSFSFVIEALDPPPPQKHTYDTKKGQLTLFQACCGMFMFISSRTEKWAFVIYDVNYDKTNVGFVSHFSGFCQI